MIQETIEPLLSNQGIKLVAVDPHLLQRAVIAAA